MKKLITCVSVVAILAACAFGDSVRTWNGDDGGPFYRVKNSGTEQVVIAADAGGVTFTVTNGSVKTTISSAGTMTVAALAAAIEASTNSAGQKLLSVDYNCALGADVVTNIVAGGVYISANQHQFVDGHKWDSSVVKHMDTYYPPVSKGGVADPKTVKKIFGDARGTGNLTIVGYVNGTEVWSSVMVSPVYVSNATGGGYTNSLTADDVTPGVIDIPVGIPVGADEGILFRATRATTMTDAGGIGMVLDLDQR